ncbi:cytochrome-c peroxidase [Paludisphaera mucosa]|uniref:Cytochrome c peroxidase n=1 Tax=Paludisphaera mucosa TaxID=3030827 RepID=A0ABT6F9R0_9BACT|nr:cytochrome c peroxidase [Paludisphaera mucosa]MDG3004327.1 cytochrome c peroxidase [Paludisphaera mucosa]
MTGRRLLIFFVLATSAAAADDDGLLPQAREHFRAMPRDMATPEAPTPPERVRLGRALFFEPRISADGTTSCSRCHLPGLQGADGLPKSIGARDFHLKRNAPTVFNAAIHSVQHWDGRFPTVEAQAKGGVTGPAFGNSGFAPVKARLAAIPGYPPLFREAFPGQDDPITADNLGAAVGAFERTLVARSRFDAFLEGKADALSPAERKGLQTFVETGCVECHKGVGVGGEGYRKFGVKSDYWKETGSDPPDEGRFGVTREAADRYKFKVPGLRDVALTAPYFHDGSVSELPKAVRIMAKVQLGDELSDEEVDAIVAFLGSLTGAEPEEFQKVPALPPGGFTAGPPAKR